MANGTNNNVQVRERMDGWGSILYFLNIVFRDQADGRDRG